MEKFHCEYAGKNKDRCPSWRCDCFIATHPDSPFDLHPEDFIVTGTKTKECVHGMVPDWCAICNKIPTPEEEEKQDTKEFLENLYNLK